MGDFGIGTILKSRQGKFYKVLAIGENIEDELKEKQVVFQSLEPPFGTFIAPLRLFTKGKEFEVMTKIDLMMTARDQGLLGDWSKPWRCLLQEL